MKDLILAHCILGMEIKRDRAKKRLWLSQQKYIEGILKRFNMQDCKLVKVPIPVGTKSFVDQCPKSQEEKEYMECVPYANAVRSLMYAMVNTQPSISHVVGVLSTYMETLGKEHWTNVKRVFRHLCGTTNLAICYHGNSKEVRVHGFINFDLARDIDGQRWNSKYVFRLFGGAINWMSRKQFLVALSTIEAEYIATTHARKEVVWLQQLCIEIGLR